MKRFFLLALIFIVLYPRQSHACSCWRSTDPFYVQASKHEGIFLGKVIKIDALSITKSDVLPPKRVHFRVFEEWKGVNNQNTVVKTPMSGDAECSGKMFELGKTYLVVADYYENELYIENHCNISRMIENSTKAAMDGPVGSLGTPEKVFSQP